MFLKSIEFSRISQKKKKHAQKLALLSETPSFFCIPKLTPDKQKKKNFNHISFLYIPAIKKNNITLPQLKMQRRCGSYNTLCIYSSYSNI